jgi:amino acid transporter
MQLFGKRLQEPPYSEKYLEKTSKVRLQFMMLIFVLAILVFTISLQFVSGHLAGNNYTDFNANVSLLVSGLLSLLSGIISYFFGVEAGIATKNQNKEEMKKIEVKATT